MASPSPPAAEARRLARATTETSGAAIPALLLVRKLATGEDERDQVETRLMQAGCDCPDVYLSAAMRQVRRNNRLGAAACLTNLCRSNRELPLGVLRQTEYILRPLY